MLPLPPETVARFPWKYSFKVQNLVENVWRDVERSKPLVSDGRIRAFILGSHNSADAGLAHVFASTLYSDPSDTRIRSLRSSVHVLVNTLWATDATQHENAYLLFKNLLDFGPELNLRLQNIACYMKEYIELKRLFLSTDASRIDFDAILSGAAPISFLVALKDRAERLERQASDLQLAGVLAGQLHSALGDRHRAATLFAENNGRALGVISSFDSGLYTYSAEVPDTQVVLGDVKYHSMPSRGATPLVVISVDVVFLRMYGTQLLFYIAALKNFPVHFHLVGDDSSVSYWIDRAGELFSQILEFRGTSKVENAPSFSSEALPMGVADPKTYYACGRFLRVNEFVHRFDRPLYILDADMALTGDPRTYLRRIQQSSADIGLVFPPGPVSIVPWRRVMAGNVYIRGTEKSLEFARNVKAYALGHLHFKRSWMLDQNSLSYAFEQFDGKVYRIGPRPFLQVGFRADLESS